MLNPQKKFLSFLMACVLLVGLIPAASAASDTRYCFTISTGNTKVYASSSLNGNPIGTIYDTDELTVLSVGSTSTKVRYKITGTNRTKDGYIPTSAILTQTSGTTMTATAQVTTYRRNSTANTYGYISKGDVVLVLGSKGDFTQIKYPIGANSYKYAFIRTSDMNKLSNGSNNDLSTSVSNGTYYLYTALASNKVADIAGGSTADGANVQLYDFNASSAQIFVITKMSNGWYQIKNLDGKVLDVSGAERRSGANVIQWSWNDGSNQWWRFISAGNGYFYIENALGYYLDVSGGGTANGTNIQVYAKNTTNAQKWRLVSCTSMDNGYATYTGVNYRNQTSDSQRIAICDKAVQMATVLWTAPCNFPTWKSSGGVYNTVTAIDGTSSTKFIAGKTYQGIPYSMVGRTNDDVKWKNLVENGLTTSGMTATYYTSQRDTTAKGIDCSYLVCTALNAGCGTSINMNTAAMLTSSSNFEKINISQMLPGDIFLKNGHTMLFMGKTSTGNYAVIEAYAGASRVVYNEYSSSELSAYGSYRYVKLI